MEEWIIIMIIILCVVCGVGIAVYFLVYKDNDHDQQKKRGREMYDLRPMMTAVNYIRPPAMVPRDAPVAMVPRDAGTRYEVSLRAEGAPPAMVPRDVPPAMVPKDDPKKIELNDTFEEFSSS